jgi:hypothetical protein
MRRSKFRVLMRVLWLVLVLAALPFAFHSGGKSVHNSPVMKISEACAQTGGRCEPQFFEICDGALGYHHYNAW